jgi:hypothetical protein
MPLVRTLTYEFKGQAHTKGKAQNSRVRFGRGKATASHPEAKPVLSSSLLLRQSRQKQGGELGWSRTPPHAGCGALRSDGSYTRKKKRERRRSLFVYATGKRCLAWTETLAILR